MYTDIIKQNWFQRVTLLIRSYQKEQPLIIKAIHMQAMRNANPDPKTREIDTVSKLYNELLDSAELETKTKLPITDRQNLNKFFINHPLPVALALLQATYSAESPMLSIAETATRINRTKREVRRLCTAGRIPGATKLDGHSWLIPEPWLLFRSPDSAE